MGRRKAACRLWQSRSQGAVPSGTITVIRTAQAVGLGYWAELGDTRQAAASRLLQQLALGTKVAEGGDREVTKRQEIRRRACGQSERARGGGNMESVC